MLGKGMVIGAPAPPFRLPDQDGEEVVLANLLKAGPVMLAFYPGDFTPVCTKQLCNYRDNLDRFSKLGVQIIGISANPVESHAQFARKYDFPFRLLSDPKQSTAKAFGCTSLLMMGGVSRAVVLINAQGVVLYRYVEPTVLSHRKSDELVGIIEDLRKHALI